MKAHLVVHRCNQKEGTNFNQVFSPVGHHTSIRVLFALVTFFDLELEQLDVKTAFLHRELEEEIYMKQPKGFIVFGKDNLVCHMKKSIYGLKQALLQWYKRFDAFMIEQGYKQCHYDNCVYFQQIGGFFVYLLWFVDHSFYGQVLDQQI